MLSAVPDAPLEPVILVHGWRGSTAQMATMQRSFETAGYRTYAIDLPGQNNVTNAQAIAGLVDDVQTETGAARVNLVGYSMGGLSTRYYIKRLDGAANVRTYVSFGTPQQGYWPACLLGEDDGGQMCPFSGFMRDLNAGDDTPGSIPYTTIRSSEDTPGIYRLDGGACFDEIPGVAHADEPNSPAFFQAALSAVQGTWPGTFVDLPIE